MEFRGQYTYFMASITVNQQPNGGQWNLLGTFDLDSASRIVLTDQADGYVIADALRIVGTAGSATPSGVYYVHTDQLGTPRAISDSTDTAVWRWDPEPFGTTAASEDPDGDGQLFTFNPRFPGQYYDDETGMQYNYFRYYDPSTGRYITSDPIGLRGGLNTYTYVVGDPVNLIDPNGLDVHVTLWPKDAHGEGHVGAGVNTDQTSGYYPTTHPMCLLWGCDVPGQVLNDPADHPGQTPITIVIPATPQQDKAMQNAIDNRLNNPGNYNLYNRNCANFVEDVLKAGQIPEIPNTKYPKDLFDYLNNTYGKPK